MLSGIPATGKSTFARHLSKNYGFAHYDLERQSSDWPDSSLHPIWENSRVEFVKQLRLRHTRIALDWGFPPPCLPWVQELLSEGVQLIWFTGDVSNAREKIIARDQSDGTNFDNQVSAIHAASLPSPLNCRIITTLSASGAHLSIDEIENLVFNQSK